MKTDLANNNQTSREIAGKRFPEQNILHLCYICNVPSFDETTQTKLTELRALRSAGTDVQVFELVKVNWPAPTNSIWYANLQTNEVAEPPPPVSPIQVRLMVDPGEPFLPIDQSSTIGDETVDLRFWDGPDSNGENEGEFSDLLIEHGEGVKVEFYLWFPQVELLLPQWEAHLQLEQEADIELVQITAAQGIRSADAEIPNRAHYQFCRAIFGGLLETDEEAEAHPECDYDKHRGGDIGTNDPDTSQPWTFCPRRDTSDCVARGVNPLRHLSHKTILTTTAVGQTGGGSIFSTTEDNGTNLDKSVRVVMGARKIYKMPVLGFKRYPNTNPDRGFFDAIFEGPEGPIEGWQFPQFNVGGNVYGADPIHLSTNRGQLQQAAINLQITTHGYSGTALLRHNSGWLNPANVDQNDANAEAMCFGLCDIRVFYDIAAGNGLLGYYYNRNDYKNLFGIREDAQINFIETTAPPFAGMSLNDFSVVWRGTLTTEDPHDWTFYLSVDDGGILIIDGDEIINETTVGNYSGTKTLAAGTYDIEIKLVAGPAASFNPWRTIFEWEASGVTRAVVPTEALNHIAVTNAFAGFRTDNRAWQALRMLCDKRWGYGKDYEAFDMDSLRESADFIDDYVTFTDSNGNEFPHYRGLSNVDLQGRKVQQQIEDMCLAGELSRPFLFNDKTHIIPLDALTEEELEAAPVFSDEGTDETRNIIWEDGKSTLRASRESSLDLYNRVELTYDSAANEYLETTAPPVEDEDAQLAAGRVQGDNTKKVNTLKESLLGVTDENQAIKLAWRWLDLGKFDEGGLQNNLRVKFRTWFMDALTVHPFKVIKVVNARLLAKYGFQYFRIVKMSRLSNLEYEIEAQAYNVEYMDAFCASAEPPPAPGGGPESYPAEIESPGAGSITLDNGIISIPIT